MTNIIYGNTNKYVSKSLKHNKALIEKQITFISRFRASYEHSTGRKCSTGK